MRRSRAPLTAWPAFADLMTILAVVSLAIAASILATYANGEDDPQETRAELRRQLADARAEAARRRAEIERQRTRIEQLEAEVQYGALPCLSRPGPPLTPLPLLRIVAGSTYTLTRLWPAERNEDVAAVPGLAEAIGRGAMDEAAFERYADAVYRYGDRDDTFGGECRFFVVLARGDGVRTAAFARALGVVNQYFLISNAAEVNRILRGGD